MDTSSRDALTTLWYFFTSSRWAALLLAVLALTAVLSMVGPHLDTSGAVTMSQGATPTRMGALTVQEPVLSGDSVRFLGGLWLRVLLAIFAFTLLLRLVDRFALAFGARRDLTRMQSTYLPGPASYDGRASSEWTEDEIRKHVSTWPGARLIRGWSVAEEKKTIFCVENVRFTMWGDWLLHLGFLVIIVGLFVSAQWGWREDDIALAAGETYELDYASMVTRSISSQHRMRMSQEEAHSRWHMAALRGKHSPSPRSSLILPHPSLSSRFRRGLRSHCPRLR